MNNETRELLLECIEFYLNDTLITTLKEELNNDTKNFDLMKKIVKLEELRQSLNAKKSSE